MVLTFNQAAELLETSSKEIIRCLKNDYPRVDAIYWGVEKGRNINGVLPYEDNHVLTHSHIWFEDNLREYGITRMEEFITEITKRAGMRIEGRGYNSKGEYVKVCNFSFDYFYYRYFSMNISIEDLSDIPASGLLYMLYNPNLSDEVKLWIELQ